jgi:uncharacterized OsmC-like protein
MSEEGRFTLELEQLEGYEFNVRFNWEQAQDLLVDEPPPLGRGRGPNASRLLAAAVGNCLSASLMYCLGKTDVPDRGVRSSVTCKVIRNERGRLRIEGLDVRITLTEELASSARLKRCTDLFEDFCVVTASVREGIDVNVELVDSQGRSLLGRS